MLSKPIHCEGICFPVAIIENEEGDFVGYLMSHAQGIELASSVFKPKLLLSKFPNWTRRELITLCVTILEKIKFLNDRRVILGDINPMNILVKSPTEVYFVDCDSYQIEGYPCSVGTANFTPPEVIGRDFKTFLRTQEMENFSIATLLFMIMLPGKAPYSAVGGASPAENIKKGNFVYAFNQADGDKTPPGRWGYMWSHLSFNVREAFFQTFKMGETHFDPQKRLSTEDWLVLFKKYEHGFAGMCAHDAMAAEIMPTRPKLRTCKAEGCDKKFVPNDREWSYCDQHRRRIGSAYGSQTIGVPFARPASQTKLCPYCRARAIPTAWDYCDSCKDVAADTRICVNCLKTFNITAGLKKWERETGFTRRQCDVCKAAGCKSSPCVHASAPTSPSRVRTQKSALNDARSANQKGRVVNEKRENSGKPSGTLKRLALALLVGSFFGPMVLIIPVVFSLTFLDALIPSAHSILGSTDLMIAVSWILGVLVSLKLFWKE